MSWSTPVYIHTNLNRCSKDFRPKLFFFLTYTQMIREYFLKCCFCFGDVQLGQLSLFSPASHGNSTRTTLLFSHHSYSSQGLLTSLLISLHVLWFGQYVFTVWAKKCWGHHTSSSQSCETRLGPRHWIWAMPHHRFAWSWVNLRPNNVFLEYTSLKVHFTLYTRSHRVAKKTKQIKSSVSAACIVEIFNWTNGIFFSVFTNKCDIKLNNDFSKISY